MKKPRVLLVEDEATIGLILKESLDHLDIESEFVSISSTEEALQLAEMGPWDLVVTDCWMKGITGLELIKILRERTPETQAILISGYRSEELERACEGLSIHQCMAKPFPLADFNRAVKNALAGRRNDGWDKPTLCRDKPQPGHADHSIPCALVS